MSFDKQGTMAKHQAHEKDTGSTKVQVALLTERIIPSPITFGPTPRTITVAGDS